MSATNHHSARGSDLLRRDPRDNRPAGRPTPPMTAPPISSALVGGLLLTIKRQDLELEALRRQAASHLLTSAGVAERLGVSTHSVRQWCQRGQIGCVVLPTGEKLFTPDDVDALLASCEHQRVTS
jgi:DNA-binding transcriptional regulator YdaS (Cro superfamily)